MVSSWWFFMGSFQVGHLTLCFSLPCTRYGNIISLFCLLLDQGDVIVPAFWVFDLTCTFFVSFFHQDWDMYMYLFYLIRMRANKYSPECIKHMSWQLRCNIWHLYTSDWWHIQRNQWPLLSIFLTPSFSVIKWKLYIKCNYFFLLFKYFISFYLIILFFFFNSLHFVAVIMHMSPMWDK